MERRSIFGLIRGYLMALLEDRSHHGHTLLRRVSELIDPVSGDWDRALIRSVFWEEDVARILCIPIKQGMEDLLAWHYDKKGVFSVKSAYHVLDDGRTRDRIRQ